MASREQLMEALRRADAAGDTEAARAIARRLAGGSSPAAAPQPSYQDALKQDAATIGDLEAFAIATGRGMHDVGQGVKQIMLNSKNIPFTSANLIAERVPALSKWMDREAAAQKQQQADELEQFDALSSVSPIAATGGRIVGNLAAAPIPGGAGASLGARVATGALAGAASAGAQYVPEGGSRLKNMTLGGALGGALPALMSGVKMTYANVAEYAKKLKEYAPNLTQASRERLAAKIIRESARDANRVANPAASPIAGVQRTLAEATDDAGIGGLQRTVQQMNKDGAFTNRMGAMQESNNAARVQALREGFGGADEGAARAIEAARNKATAPLLQAAYKGGEVNVKPVVKLADRIIKGRQGNKTVVGVISEVRDLLADPSIANVRNLHNARQEINNIIGGLSPNKEAGKAATRELLSIRAALDAQIGKTSPEFRQFLRQFTDASRDAGRIRMGDELLGKSMGLSDNAGNPVLSPAKFAGASKDLDRVAVAATGFRKSTAEGLMTPEQRALVANVNDDLQRFGRSRTAGNVADSGTQQNLAGMTRLQDALVGGRMGEMLPPVLNTPFKVMDSVRQVYGAKTLEVLQDAMLDPAQAKRLLARFPPEQRAQIRTLLESPQFQQAFQRLSQGSPAIGAAAYARPGTAEEPQQ